MPIARFEMPDGRVARFEVPEGTSPEQAQAMIAQAVKPTVKQTDINGPTNPTEGMSGLQKFAAGAGKAFMDVGRGVGQLVGAVDQNSIDEAKKLDAPLMNTGAGMAGNVVGNMAAFAPTMAIPGANTLTGASLIGAAMGGSQPVATGESRLQNAAMGGAGGFAGQGIANTMGRVARPVQSSLNPVEAGLAQKASQMGIPLTIGQKTGSRPLQITESVLENLPFTADKQLAIKEAQRMAFNKATSKTIGENADLITPEVLNSAKTRIGKQFQDLSARNVVGLDSEFVDALAKVDASKTVFSSSKISDTIEKALELASQGKISGTEYQKVRSSLGKAASSAFSTDAELGQALKSIRSALDAAAERSISSADKKAWGQARQQWQALKVLEKAAAPTSADAVAGNVSPAKLANALNSVDKNFKYGTGQQELGDLARVGKAFIQDSIPNSGTAQRTFYQNLIENPLRVIPGAAGVGSIPIQAMMNSKLGQSYLMNGMIPQNQVTGLLGAAGGRGLALGAPSLLYAGQQ